MALSTLEAILTLDSSGFQSGLNQAQSALSTFASVAGGVFAGIGAANFLSDFTSGIGGLVNFVVGTTSDFESYGSTIAGVLDGINQSGVDMGAGVAGGSAKAKTSALEAQDALIKYNEKIKEIQSNIVEVMAGQNVTDAQTKFTDQMAMLQENYAAKVQEINNRISQAYDDLTSKKADIEQRAADTLSDMQATHDNQMADKKEKQALEMSKTASNVTKAALQKQYNEENKLAEDSYQRQLTTKKAELDRNVKEQEEAAQDTADKQVAHLKDQLTREAALQEQKQDKLKKQEANEITRLETQNAKKLALYQRELADEERSYALSTAKRAASGGGGGRGGILSNLTPLQEGTDKFSAYNETLQGVQKTILDWTPGTPFTIHDVEEADQHLVAMGVNAERMNPIIGNLAGTMHTTFGTGTQSVLAALNGRFAMLHYQLGINRQMVEHANFDKPISSAEQLFEALEKISKSERFAQGLQRGLETLPGQMSNVQDRVQQLALAFMGFNPSKELKEQDPNSLFMMLYHTIEGFANFLKDHKDQLRAFATTLGTDVVGGIKAVEKAFVAWGTFITPIITILLAAWAQIEPAITPVAGKVASVIIPAFSTFAQIIRDFVVQALQAITPLLGGVLRAMQPVGDFLLRVGIPLFLDIAKTISGLVVGALRTMGKVWQELAPYIQPVITHLMHLLGDVLPPLWAIIKNLIIPALEALGSDILTRIVIPAVKGLLILVDDWIIRASNLVNAWKKVVDFFKGAAKEISGIFKTIGDAVIGSHINPNAHGSPSLVEEVQSGVNQIKTTYASLLSIQLPGLASGLGGISSGLGGGHYNQNMNYNTTSNLRTSNVTMNNNFSITGQASAANVAEYLAFQSSHWGAV